MNKPLFTSLIICCSISLSLSAQTGHYTNLTVQRLNSVRFADQFPGATADAQINAAIADLPSGGGIVNAEGLIGSQRIAAPVSIRSNMTLTLPAGATWTCTITAGTACFELSSDSAMTSSGHGANSTHIVLASNAKVSEMLMLGGSAVSSHYRVDGVEFSGSLTATVINSIVNVQGVYDSSFRNLTVDTFPGKGLWIHDLSSTISDNSLDFYSLLLDGGQSGQPLIIEQNIGATNLSQIRFYGGDFGHPGSGNSLITINGHGYSSLAGIYFYGTYMESNASDTTTPIVSISDASNVLFDGVFTLRENPNSSAFGFSISETVVYLTNNVSIRNATVTGATSRQSILNSIDSNYTVSTSSVIGDYVFLNKNNGGEIAQFGPIQTTANSVTIQGNLNVIGSLSKSSGSFLIDHPLDPANKYLEHSFVESPDMLNIYTGNVLLDSHGEAWVQLPAYFQALNRDFQYQLTAVGSSEPNLYIGRQISTNHFKIAGGKPGGKVSWQVTGIRHDAYAEAHPIRVEQDKSSKERGHYLHPELFDADQTWRARK